MKNLIKKIPQAGLPIVLCVLMAIVFFYTISLRMNATSLGGGLGSCAGSLAGKAIGSLEGMTTGRAEGTAAGKAAGLSAEDTEAKIANQIQQVETLEVLVAILQIIQICSRFLFSVLSPASGGGEDCKHYRRAV